MYRRYGDITWEPVDAASGAASTASGSASTTLSHRPHSRRRASRAARPLAALSLPTISMDGIRLHAITEKQCIDHILDELDAGRGGMVVTPNLDHLRRCTCDLSFSALIAEADVVVPDGMPLIWASKLQGTPLPQRVAGSDLIKSLSAAAANRGRSVFLLGGAPGSAEGAAEVLRKSSPNIKIVGMHCPPYGFETNKVEEKKMLTALIDAAPDIIYVALGSPKQEMLIQRIRQACPKAWWLGVGISFSFLCGQVKRAPKFIQNIGMEWVHRMVQDPKRLFPRYVLHDIPYGIGLMCRSTLRGVPRRFRRGNTTRESLPITIPETTPPPLPISAESVAPTTAAPQRPRRRNGANGNGNGNGNGHATATTNAPAGIHVGNLSRLRALVLLGGSVRSSPLITACDRSLLDLPLDENGSIFNHWLAQARELARYAGIEELPVRVMVNRNTPEPASAAPAYYGKFRVERDLSEYRGTGGVLRDLAANYDDDDLIMVCNAAQVLLDPLVALATALDKKDGDVTLVSHNDGTPSGVQLIRCNTLRMVQDVGFVDMKEQGLALISEKYDVTVLHCRRPTGLPVRSLADYIVAMRHYHRRRLGKPALSDPLGEDWQPAFAIAEQGSNVDPRAHVHDAVVLKGGVVEPGAVVVRSIVCPGGVVKKDRPAVDQLICVAEKPQ